jgi:putative endonuclease
VEKSYCVYIMSSVSKVLYTSMTNDLEKRVFEHKSKRIPGFPRNIICSNASIFKLSVISATPSVGRNRSRDGYISKKVALIESVNPQSENLAEEHYKSGTKFKRPSS